MKQHTKPIILVVTIAGMLIAITLLPVIDWLTLSIDWIQAHRTLAWILFIVAYTIATVFVIPVSIFSLAAGFVFSVPIGVLLVSAGSILGASAAFFVGRFFARDWAAKRIENLPRFRALDQATRHRGFLMVFLARLSPLFPFNLINYGLALTSVRFRDYFFASWIGMLPVTILYVYVGSTARDLTKMTSGNVQSGMAGQILLFIGLAATMFLVIIVSRKATSTLSQHLASESVKQDTLS